MTDAPFSQQAEEACIGAVLIHPLSYLNIAAFLKPEDFFFLRHTYIWQAIGNLESKHSPIDTVTVSEELQSMNVLAEIGGPAYLTQLIRDVPTSIHSEVYGSLVKRAAQRRELMLACDTIRVLAGDESMTVNKVFELAETELLSVTVSERKQTETDIESIVHSYMDNIEKLVELRGKGITPGLPTGYPSVDALIGGSYKQELMIIAAPPKSGKSSYNLNVVRNRAKLGACIVIFITEMNRQAIVRKFISMETGISMDDLKNARFTPHQFSLFVEASNRISKWKVHIVDDYTSNLTPLDVRRELRRIMHKESVDSVLIDGLWMMKSNKQSHSKADDVTQIVIDLVEIAKKMNIPIDLVHQCSRAAESRRDHYPRLSDFSDSSGVEKNCYTAIFLYRENFYKKSGSPETEIIVAANRDGNMGSATLGFDKQSETYRELKSVSKHVTPTAIPDDERKDIHQ